MLASVQKLTKPSWGKTASLLAVIAILVAVDGTRCCRAGETWFTISKETTYVTRPLDQDGYVDYLAALNEAASEGVTVENNAAVLLAPAMDLSMLSEPDRVRFFKMLGIATPAKSPVAVGLFPKIIKGESAESGLELVRRQALVRSAFSVIRQMAGGATRRCWTWRSRLPSGRVVICH